MVSVQTGTPYTTTLTITDSDGAPVTSGVGGSGATLLGPTSTTAIATGIAVVHFGGGVWGVTWAGLQLAAAGLYRVTVPTLTFGSTTIYNTTILFTVGEVPAEYRTLGAIIASVYTALDDGQTGTGTGGTNTLTDGARSGAGIDDNEWVDNELLILGPASAIPATNPMRVVAFEASTGEFTVKPDTNLSGTLNYLLCNRNGAGHGYGRVREAVDTTIGAIHMRERVSDAVSLVATQNSWEYQLPAGWRAIEGVGVGTDSAHAVWDEVAPGYWEFDAGRRVFRDKYGMFPAGRAIRLSGIIDVPPPATLGSVVPLPWTWVRDMAVAELLLDSESQADQRRAAVLLQRAQQRRPRAIVV